MLHCIIEHCCWQSGVFLGNTVSPIFPDMASSIENKSCISLVPVTGVRRVARDLVGKIQFATPNRHDVLFGTRLDSLHLWGGNNILDYHPGNQEWQYLVREVAASLQSQKLKKSFVAQPGFLQDAILQSVYRKTQGRYLLQLPGDGKLAILTVQQSLAYTRKAIIVEENTLLFLLDEAVSFMVSFLRYESPLRTKPICAITIGVLEEIREKLFHIKSAENESDVRGLLYARTKQTSFGSTTMIRTRQTTDHPTRTTQQSPGTKMRVLAKNNGKSRTFKFSRMRSQRRWDRTLAYMK